MTVQWLLRCLNHGVAAPTWHAPSPWLDWNSATRGVSIADAFICHDLYLAVTAVSHTQGA